MKWCRSMTVYGVHAESEVGRVITGGIIDVPGDTMLDKMLYMNEKDDTITGAVDATVEWNVRIWDLAATQLLVEEAGGAYQCVKQIKQPGIGTIYSAVFGKRKLVSKIANLLTR